jgi:hypothetical protein
MTVNELVQKILDMDKKIYEAEYLSRRAFEIYSEENTSENSNANMIAYSNYKSLVNEEEELVASLSEKEENFKEAHEQYREMIRDPRYIISLEEYLDTVYGENRKRYYDRDKLTASIGEYEKAKEMQKVFDSYKPDHLEKILGKTKE